MPESRLQKTREAYAPDIVPDDLQQIMRRHYMPQIEAMTTPDGHTMMIRKPARFEPLPLVIGPWDVQRLVAGDD